MLEHALAALRRGWFVYPIQPRAKKPIDGLYDPGTGLGGFQLASSEERQIRQWWRIAPHANPGIACGASGLVVLDFDFPAGGRRALDEMIREHGLDLESTYTVKTPHGVHVYFRQPKSNPVVKHNSGLPGLDILGEGQGIVGVGGIVKCDKKGCHHNGAEGQYVKWSK